MELRVTSQVQASQIVASLRQQAAAQAAIEQQLTTGDRLQRPSDGPSDYVAAQSANALSQRLGVYQDTATTATADLNASVSALQDGSQALTQAATLASQGINSATDPTSYAALAAQVNSLIDRMVSDGNAQINGRYLFGGTATQQAPFTVSASNAAGQATTITYQGTDQRSQALVGPGQTVETHYAGNQVFQAPGSDVFQTLIQLRDTLNNTSLDTGAKTQALTQQLAQIQTARNGMLQTVGEQSATLESLTAVQSRLQDVQLSAQERVGDLQGTDYATALVQLQEQQNAYQATLAMASRAFSTSLLDYMH